MSAEEHKSAVRRFSEEVWNGHDPSKVDDFFAPTHVVRQPGGETMDREGHRAMIAQFQSAFPDGVNTNDELLAEGDKVVQRWSFQGTHLGAFMGIPPSGASVSLTGISIWRFLDGVIVESWHEMDNLGLLGQLGLTPAPAQVARATP